MSKFWAGAGLFLLIGVVAVFAAGGSSKVHVNDLETECRGDRASSTQISLNSDNSMSFKGYFPMENTDSDMNYKYSQSSGKIVLNVRSQNLPTPTSFWNNCLASGVYDIDTQDLDSGRYAVTVKHNGERAEKRIIRVD
jgi:hypothetical protein